MNNPLNGVIPQSRYIDQYLSIYTEIKLRYIYGYTVVIAVLHVNYGENLKQFVN